MTSSISSPTPAPVPLPLRIYASSDSSPLFSVQDALSTYSGFNSTYLPSAEQGSGILFRSGCVVDGNLNCTAACQDVNQIFADPHIFQNCMVMASLTSFISGVTLDGSSTTLAEDFSIHVDQPSFPSLANRVNQTIQDCLHQYLDKYPLVNSNGMEYWLPWYYGFASYEPKYAYLGFPSVCNNLLAPLNADVGGIGVRKGPLFTKTMLTHGRYTSLTGFKAASPSQLSWR